MNLERSERPFRLSRAPALVVLAAAVALVGCGPHGSEQASDSAHRADRAVDKAAQSTKAAIDSASARAGPAAERAARDAQRGLHRLATATGQAMVKAGRDLEHAGDNKSGSSWTHGRANATGD